MLLRTCLTAAHGSVELSLASTCQAAVSGLNILQIGIALRNCGAFCRQLGFNDNDSHLVLRV